MPTTTTPVTVTVIRTGGIAGVNQEVTIAPSGAWSYTDRRAGKTETGQLAPGDIDELSRLVRNPELTREAAKKNPGVCSDAFNYTVSAGDLRVAFEDNCGQGDRPTLDQLIRLVSDKTAM